MSGEEQITEVENRYSEYKIVSNDETNKFIAYLEKHDNLKVSNSEIDFSIKLKFSSYKKILNQMNTPLELLVNYIKFLTVSQTVNYETPAHNPIFVFLRFVGHGAECRYHDCHRREETEF